MIKVWWLLVLCAFTVLGKPTEKEKDARCFKKVRELAAMATNANPNLITPKTDLRRLTPLERRRLAHYVERQFGFGVSDQDIDHYFSYNLQGVVNYIMEMIPDSDMQLF